ncbi:hypothetical protein AAFC00_003237 [Neodothiora populina]|uniref:Arabinanase/levansucrase/invertase n=1 Tax=Neodothiora populina TaxID=2781224 RepID=A0ABR3P9R8_9PEZI
MALYNNSVLNVTNTATPDPYVIHANDNYFLTFTAGDRVEIWCADSLLNFNDRCSKHVVWRPPPDTDYSNDVWAPELHRLQGRWYIYVAACNPHKGNKSHRMIVLGGPPAYQDPVQGPWEFLGPIRDMDQRQWAIDGTVIELDGQMYFVYSGWPFDNPNESDLIQRLFILRLSDPITASSPAVEICRPAEPFERTGDHHINEGPQYLASPDGSWRGIAYSCSGSWTNEYKMNTLRFRGGDPLNPGAWGKSMNPLVQTGTNGNGPWGPGHGSFMHIGDETVAIYHATDGPSDGWNNRKARMQRVVFNDGGPFMGGGVGVLTDVHTFMGADHGSESHSSKKHGIKGLLHKLLD